MATAAWRHCLLLLLLAGHATHATSGTAASPWQRVPAVDSTWRGWAAQQRDDRYNEWLAWIQFHKLRFVAIRLRCVPSDATARVVPPSASPVPALSCTTSPSRHCSFTPRLRPLA